MSVSRVLCIVAATAGLHISSTSPNPPPLQSEKAIAPTGVEFILASYPLRITLTCIYWIVAILETVVIMVQIATPSIWAERILHTLAMGGDPSQVNLSATPTILHFTFETGIFHNHKLITTGPYSIVRHPSYSGAWIAYVGLMLYYGSSGSWVLECLIKGSLGGRLAGVLYALIMFLVVTGLTGRIPKEDEALRNEFGKEWEDWASGTYALFPFVY
ncbi:hypothetical protein MVEN_01783900 [Mycena venus]|uniref:Protein-S-isoprenylcysteine O-methyltransferase n=1 Tax=Mycena venus TaxID=2733690 RepID=A0A8H6XK49_9AGAR|nr:hypothetical protein MVEN_01783900 [Mycena venus]